jgi:four helix bundle protein
MGREERESGILNLESSKTTIRNFTDLDTWKQGHRLVIHIYSVTKQFPVDEQFGLISQIRRAAVSVTSNIAEGFSRSSYGDKGHFFTIAHGSLTEVQNQLLISRDVGYLSQAEFDKLAEQTVVIHRLLNGLIKSTKQKHHKIQNSKF